MPIEINELLIEVKVSEQASSEHQPAQVANSSVIAECIDQVMMVINTSKER